MACSALSLDQIGYNRFDFGQWRYVPASFVTNGPIGVAHLRSLASVARLLAWHNTSAYVPCLHGHRWRLNSPITVTQCCCYRQPRARALHKHNCGAFESTAGGERLWHASRALVSLGASLDGFLGKHERVICHVQAGDASGTTTVEAKPSSSRRGPRRRSHNLEDGNGKDQMTPSVSSSSLGEETEASPVLEIEEGKVIAPPKKKSRRKKKPAGEDGDEGTNSRANNAQESSENGSVASRSSTNGEKTARVGSAEIREGVRKKRAIVDVDSAAGAPAVSIRADAARASDTVVGSGKMGAKSAERQVQSREVQKQAEVLSAKEVEMPAKEVEMNAETVVDKLNAAASEGEGEPPTEKRGPSRRQRQRARKKERKLEETLAGAASGARSAVAQSSHSAEAAEEGSLEADLAVSAESPMTSAGPSLVEGGLEGLGEEKVPKEAGGAGPWEGVDVLFPGEGEEEDGSVDSIRGWQDWDRQLSMDTSSDSVGRGVGVSADGVPGNDEPEDAGVDGEDAEGRGEMEDGEEVGRPSGWPKLPENIQSPRKRRIRKKVIPREEPWLYEAALLAERAKVDKMEAEREAEAARAREEEGRTVVVGEEAVDGVKVQVPEPVTEIIINAPESTLSRVAIMEDGKLVELLLEPVDTNVQVGDVYLGVVKRLLPGMAGVFVDIGEFRVALLEIVYNQYPFTFPCITPPGDRGGFEAGDGLADGLISEGDDSELDDKVEAEYSQQLEESLGQPEDSDAGVGGLARSGSGPDLQRLGWRTGLEVAEAASVEGREWERGAAGAADVQEGEVGIAEAEVVPERGSTLSGASLGHKYSRWRRLCEGMLIVVQVKKEAIGQKGPRLTAFPGLAGRFLILVPRGKGPGVSEKIKGPERGRLREIVKKLQPPGFGLIARTEAAGHELPDIQRDLEGLTATWREIMSRASTAAGAVEEGLEATDLEHPSPVLLHKAMGQALSIARDVFTDRVRRMVVDSHLSYQEVTSYLQCVAPHLCDRVELYTGRYPIFDAFGIETQIEKFSNKRVRLENGGYLVIEETEALVTIDVNGGTMLLGQVTSTKEAALKINLSAARQIPRELRLRDMGGIIVVDFLNMDDPKNKQMVVEEMKKALLRDRSRVAMSDISNFGLMQLTRKRVRPSINVAITEQCSCCRGVGRLESSEWTLSRVEHSVRRTLAQKPGRSATEREDRDSKLWPKLLLRCDASLSDFLLVSRRKRLMQLNTALKVWITVKSMESYDRGQFQVLELPGRHYPSQGEGSSSQQQSRYSMGVSGSQRGTDADSNARFGSSGSASSSSSRGRGRDEDARRYRPSIRLRPTRSRTFPARRYPLVSREKEDPFKKTPLWRSTDDAEPTDRPP